MSRRKKFTGYIYCITNLINGKRYVGQTYQKGGIEARWGDHKSALRNNKHDNKHLQSAWNKYGEDNFKWEVLHTLKFSNKDTLQEALNDLETMYISIWNLLDADYGYNISSGGSNGNPHAGKTEEEMKLIRKKMSEAQKGKKLSEETKKKISEAQKGRKPSKETKQKLSEVNKIAMNRPEVRKKISEANKGKYIGDKNPTRRPEVRKKLSEAKKGDKNPIAKKVAQYTIQGEYIKTWNCIMDADRELGVNNANIVLCCKRQQKTAGNYRWSYLNEDGSIPVLEPLKPNGNSKPVAMISKETGEILKVFECVGDANEYLGKKRDRDNISACARGICNTSHGYKWKFVSDLTQEAI